jgi:hypothetical protein
MKVIGRAGGVSALREAQEEYIPERPPPAQDIINFVKATYQFVSFPVLAAGTPLLGPWVFAGGRFTEGEQTFAISQLVMLPEGDIVATTSTNDSDLVMEHLMALMDDNFGYRLRAASKKRSYMSTIVVEFERSVSDYIDAIGKIEEMINRGRSSPLPFKSISFGGDTSILAQENLLLNIESANFTIERRVAQEPKQHLDNRYFCNAPMTTDDHIEALQQIEVILREGSIPISSTRPT